MELKRGEESVGRWHGLGQRGETMGRVGWPIFWLVVGLLFAQTISARSYCQKYGNDDDVVLGYCYATQIRDSGNLVAQVVDTFNFDVMKLTGQHHQWGRR